MRSRSLGLLLVLGGLAFVAYGVAKLVVDRQNRAYGSTYGARIVRYTLDSRLLHRTSGPDTLLRASLLRALDGLGRRRPTVVLLDGGTHSYYHDRADGPWGSMILDEAIPDAKRRFAIAGPVALGGISMGGFGALHLAASAPRSFCAVGVRSATLWRSGGETPAGAFDDAADFDRTDVFAAASAGRFRSLPLWVDDGDRDPFLTADTAFAHQVGATFHEWPGGHTYAYWDAHVPAYLAFFAHACRWAG